MSSKRQKYIFVCVCVYNMCVFVEVESDPAQSSMSESDLHTCKWSGGWKPVHLMLTCRKIWWDLEVRAVAEGGHSSAYVTVSQLITTGAATTSFSWHLKSAWITHCVSAWHIVCAPWIFRLSLPFPRCSMESSWTGVVLIVWVPTEVTPLFCSLIMREGQPAWEPLAATVLVCWMWFLVEITFGQLSAKVTNKQSPDLSLWPRGYRKWLHFFWQCFSSLYNTVLKNDKQTSCTSHQQPLLKLHVMSLLGYRLNKIVVMVEKTMTQWNLTRSKSSIYFLKLHYWHFLLLNWFICS